jgi:methionyl-tRNA formyltransferase
VRVLFFGTPEFAVPSLRALVGEGFEVLAAVTRPDRPTGRHRSTLEASAVKRAAEAEGIPVFQPERPSLPGFIDEVRELAPDVSVVVAYGHILPAALLDVPPNGSINVHASLLPRLRGAAPIQRAILEGLTETGVTIMRMDEGMDTGPVLHQVPTPIEPDETGGELATRLSELGALALVEALTLLDESGLEPRPQDERLATWAPKLTREEERLSFTAGAEHVARRIRAFDPSPGAWCAINGRALKLFGGRAVEAAGPPGEVLEAGESLRIACGAGAVEVAEVQPEGRSRMSVRAFVNGRGISKGDRLG